MRSGNTGSDDGGGCSKLGRFEIVGATDGFGLEIILLLGAGAGFAGDTILLLGTKVGFADTS